jgi:ferredoxin--NADP+ reductase
MPDAVIEGLRSSQVRDIHVLSRRGPAHAKFTPVELRELGTLANADVVVDPADLVLDAESVEIAGASRDVTTNLKLLTEWSERPMEGKPRRITFHFWTIPLELHGEVRVDELLIRRQPPGHEAVDSALPVGLVLRAIGYRPEPVPGVPYDEQRGVVPNTSGRVHGPDGTPLPGEYVAGWLKRGPSGVIGTNRADALETVTALAEDLPTLAQRNAGDGLPPRLIGTGAQVVDWAAWKRLEAHEEQLGVPRAATSVKLADRLAMLDVCSREPVAAEG